MASRQSNLSWTFIDEESDPDAAYAARFGTNIPLPADGPTSPARPYDLLLVGLLLVVCIGYLAWQEGKAYLPNTQAEAPVLANTRQDEAMQQGQMADPLADQLALIEVEIDPSALNELPIPYRSKRFYRQVAGVWQPITPGIEYWGEMRTLETVYFRVEFYERDAAVVEEVALDLDGLWQTLHYQVGLAQPSPHEKLAIQVLPNSGHHWHVLNPFKLPSALPVSSPTVLPIPISLSEAEMLRGDIVQQLVTLTLFHKIAPASSEAWWGDSGVQGLLRWLGDQVQAGPMTPIRDATLKQAWQDQLAENPTPRLADISTQRLQPREHTIYWVETILLPTLDRQTMTVESAINYALTAYGQKHLPALIEAIRRQEPWTELVPEIFGVSVETFERGWHESLRLN